MKRMANSILFFALAASTSSLVASDEAPMIVGGEKAEPGDYPYYVQILGCGGALVAPDVVLTAAHCKVFQNMEVIVGAYTRDSTAEGAQKRRCEQWTCDPKYDDSTLNYDICLCKLDSPVEIDESSVVLELNTAASVPSVGEELVVMGLGTTSFGGNVAGDLQHVTVPYINNQRCSMNDVYGGMITNAMLCAGYMEGKKDSCQGDSGGPIVKRVQQSNGTYKDYHVGVVSWGIGCAAPKRPGVYARTSERIDWIQDIICDLSEFGAPFCEQVMGGCENDSTQSFPYKDGQSLTCQELAGLRYKKMMNTCNMYPAFAQNCPGICKTRKDCQCEDNAFPFALSGKKTLTCDKLAGMNGRKRKNKCKRGNKIKGNCPGVCGTGNCSME